MAIPRAGMIPPTTWSADTRLFGIALIRAVPQDFPDITRAKAGIPYRAKATRKDGTKFMSLTPLIFPFSSIPSALWIQKEFTVI